MPGKSPQNRNEKKEIILQFCLLWKHAGCASEHMYFHVFMCNFSTADRAEHAPTMQDDSRAFHIYEHTQIASWGGYRDVTRDKVRMLTSGPDYICQPHTHAVRIKDFIYWENEVTQTRDVNTSRWTRSLWSCQGCYLWVINIYVSDWTPSSLVMCFIMWSNPILVHTAWCTSVYFSNIKFHPCSLSPSLSTDIFLQDEAASSFLLEPMSRVTKMGPQNRNRSG